MLTHFIAAEHYKPSTTRVIGKLLFEGGEKDPAVLYGAGGIMYIYSIYV